MYRLEEREKERKVLGSKGKLWLRSEVLFARWWIRITLECSVHTSLSTCRKNKKTPRMLNERNNSLSVFLEVATK